MGQRVFSQTFGVVGAILVKDNKVLLVKEGRHSKGIDEGKWSHPAGWIDVGEDPIEAVKREVVEESGYQFEPTGLIGVYSLVRKDMEKHLQATPQAIKLIFKGNLLNEVPAKLADDVTETQWFTPAEIYAMDSTALRDVDIKKIVKDCFEGREAPIDLVVHTVQVEG